MLEAGGGPSTGRPEVPNEAKGTLNLEAHAGGDSRLKLCTLKALEREAVH